MFQVEASPFGRVTSTQCVFMFMQQISVHGDSLRHWAHQKIPSGFRVAGEPPVGCSQSVTTILVQCATASADAGSVKRSAVASIDISISSLALL